MTVKTPMPAAGILLIMGGLTFVVLGGLHAVYTFMDLHIPRRLVPADPSVAQAMANSSLRLSRGNTYMWHTWVGLNLTHSLGLLLFGAVAIWAGTRINTFSAGIVPALTLVGCIYVAISLRYFFAALQSALLSVQAASQAHGCCSFGIEYDSGAYISWCAVARPHCSPPQLRSCTSRPTTPSRRSAPTEHR